MLCEEKDATLRVVPVDDQGELSGRVRATAEPTHQTGRDRACLERARTVLPVREIVALAHRRGIPVLVDGAQAVPHMTVNVQELDCDFYAFSGHKLYGPTGIGVLYGKSRTAEAMPPYQGGGDMIRSVTFEKTTYNTLPYKFEAGTPDIAGVVGLARGDRLRERRSASTTSPPTSANCWLTQPRSLQKSTACASSGLRSTRPR